MNADSFALKVVATLANERVKLVPLEEKHITPLFIALKDSPDIWTHMPSGPYSSEAELTHALLHNAPFAGPQTLTYAVIDKTRPAEPGSVDEEGQFAGTMSYMESNALNRTTELGAIIVFPAFRRTHVTSNAVGLMMQHAFRPAEEGGLDVVRLVWQTSTQNEASLRVAKRFGFRQEGVLRWHRVFPGGKAHGKVGNGEARIPRGIGEQDLWRHTVILGICWDDWEDGVKEDVAALMARTS